MRAIHRAKSVLITKVPFGTAFLQILAAVFMLLLLHELSRLIMVAKCGTTHVGPSYWLTSNSAALAVAPKAHARARMAAQDFIVCFTSTCIPENVAWLLPALVRNMKTGKTKERVSRRKSWRVPVRVIRSRVKKMNDRRPTTDRRDHR